MRTTASEGGPDAAASGPSQTSGITVGCLGVLGLRQLSRRHQDLTPILMEATAAAKHLHRLAHCSSQGPHGYSRTLIGRRQRSTTQVHQRRRHEGLSSHRLYGRRGRSLLLPTQEYHEGPDLG